MKKSLKLLYTLLVMVGFYQGYCSQTIAGTQPDASKIPFFQCWDDHEGGFVCLKFEDCLKSFQVDTR
ncbi:hypothetical protein [Bartonella tribocorum]|uniref:Uncharacterized protein n=1 Tax=Bartonella tribocorum TaxID=85701 RepID=A0A2N9Y8Q6_9HYPH|nr:hypothetical protein [Bartonella tribocorum]PIT68089.1 hypothetical protein CEV08_08655 [Bartonella tribocorum]